ncbi:MAG: EVE domain-containing protein [Spirochaetia bacterium]|nr:EVE domain-containing protein [Spirochaetia bacterium]
MKHWINTVSLDHVLIGKKLGILQAGHGKKAPLARLSQGDLVLYYSPKTSLDSGEALKQFTAIAVISGSEIYQTQMSEDFAPFRLDARYLACQPVEITPLIDALTFITNKASWGFIFRRGLFQIPKHDFDLIAGKMGAL